MPYSKLLPKTVPRIPLLLIVQLSAQLPLVSILFRPQVYRSDLVFIAKVDAICIIFLSMLMQDTFKTLPNLFRGKTWVEYLRSVSMRSTPLSLPPGTQVETASTSFQTPNKVLSGNIAPHAIVDRLMVGLVIYHRALFGTVEK